MSSPPFFGWYHGGSTNKSRNEISPPCIMLKQTSDPCPGLAIRFPFPYTSLTELPLCRMTPRPAPGLLQLGAGQIFPYSIFLRFSPRHPDLRAAVPALYDKIGIPALHRGHELGLGTYSRVHDPVPAYRAAHMAHLLHHLMAMPLLLPAHFIYAPFCSRRSVRRGSIWPAMKLFLHHEPRKPRGDRPRQKTGIQVRHLQRKAGIP